MVDTPEAGPTAQADLVITNCLALVASSPVETTFVGGTTIVVRDGLISDMIGPGDDRVVPPAADVIDARGMVVMPGLINTHCHAAMTYLRGAAEDVAVDTWFNDYIWPMEVNVDAHDVYIGTMVAAAEMIECGVTTFADHYFFMDQAAQAVVDSGVRANMGSAFFSSQGDAGLAESATFADRWNGAAGGRITTSLAPHAQYTVTNEHLAESADEARRLGVRVHIHASEDIAQTNSSLAIRGRTPIQVLDDVGILDAGAIIAHGNGILPEDIPLLAGYRDRVGVTHGPKGYLKFALGPLTPIRDLLDAGVAVGYCTDGAASNNTLDILENMRITAMLQKQLHGDGTWFRSALALHLAGPLSAATLGLGDSIGRLAKGMAADIILVDVSGFHCQPVHDLAATLVYAVQPGDVRTTIVAGRVLMRDRQLTTIDRGPLLSEFRARAAEITDRAHGRKIQDYAP
jgi:5-methylthioadenosine/S-adenosylhomocysteine deaminase